MTEGEKETGSAVSANQSMNALEGLTDMVSQETSQEFSEARKENEESNSDESSQTTLFPGVQNEMGNQNEPQVNAQENNQGATDDSANTEDTSDNNEESSSEEASSAEGNTLDDDFTATIESPLLGGEQKIGKSNEAASSKDEAAIFENIDNFSAHLKESYGIEDVKSLGGQIEAWKSDSEELSKLSVQHGNVETLFKTMPSELYSAIDRFTKGEDWKGALNTSSVDFSKNSDDYSDKDIVEAMAPGKITAEDWEEFNDEEGDPNVKRLVKSAIDSSKEKFERKKVQINDEATRKIELAQQSQKLFGESVSKSKEAFKAKFGNATPAMIEEIEQAFTQPGGLVSLMYDDNGMLNEDAFLRYAMAKHGEGLISQYRAVAEREIETRTTQNILATGASAPATSQGSQSSQRQEDIREDVQKEINSIKGLM